MRNPMGALLAVWSLVLPALAVTAAPGPDITSVDTSRYPLVSVTAVTGAQVRGLEDFTVTQDGAPRPIAWARSVKGPIQVALVIDASRNMRDDLRGAAASATELLLHLPADAEASLVSAGGDVRVVVERTPDIGAMIAALADLRATGDPALLQAVPLAVDQLTAGPAGRRALVVVAGAGDADAARIDEVARLLRESGISLFGVSLGGDLLGKLARTAGGSVQRADAIAEPHAGVARVADDLTNLYRIDFTAYGGDAPTAIAVGIGRQPAQRASVTLTLPERDGEVTVLPRAATADPSGATVWPLVLVVTVGVTLAGGAALVRRRHVAVSRLVQHRSEREVQE